MPRDRLLLAEMIDAATRIIELTAGLSVSDIEGDRDRREILLWNYTVLGEAAAQVSDDMRSSAPDLGWTDPVRLRNRIVHETLTLRAS